MPLESLQGFSVARIRDRKDTEMDADIGLWHVDELLGELRALPWHIDDLTAEAHETDNDMEADAIYQRIEAMQARFMDLFAELDNRLTLGEAPPAEWRTFH